MTEQEFLKIMTFMSVAYSKEVDAGQTSVWYTFFRDDDYDQVRMAVKQLCVTSKFFPSIAEIKAAMAENSTQQLTSDQAWEEVQKAITRYGYYQAEEAMKSLPETTQYAVMQLGGFQRVCSSESGDWLRKDFSKIYDDLRSRNITRYVTGDLITIADIAEHRKRIETREEEIVF